MDDNVNTSISVADHPITQTSDLIGTIGFGALIGLGGLPCIVMNPTDPVLIAAGLIPIIFGFGWGYLTWRKWNIWRVFHPFEVRVSPTQANFDDEVQIECSFVPKKNIEIEEATLAIRVTRVTMEHLHRVGTVARPVVIHEDSERVLANEHFKKNEEVRFSVMIPPDTDFPPSKTMGHSDGETIIWSGYARVKVKGLRAIEHSVNFEMHR